jgi:RNA polymerase sigma-70 factor, ECF subfamily
MSSSSNPPQIQPTGAAVESQTAASGGDGMQAFVATGKRPAGAVARPELTDLLGRIAVQRDREAFARLFQLVGPQVKGMLVRQGADYGTAEEIVQDTFLTVWRKAELFVAARGSAVTWIYTIARNLRIDRLRREVPWQELGEDHLEQASGDPLQDDQLAAEQIQARLRSVLETLPADQGEVVALAYTEGLSHGEIAGRLDIPLGTVKSRMRLAYQKIKDALAEAS